MSDLDLSLPQVTPPSGGDPSGPNWVWRAFVSCGILSTVVGVWLPKEGSTTQSHVVEMEKPLGELPFNEDLYLKLKKAGAHGEAARLLSTAIANQGLSSERRAELLKDRGDLHRAADDHQRAIADYYRAELLANEEPLKRELAQDIVDTLRFMGRYDALGDELQQRNRNLKQQSSTDTDSTVAVVDGIDLKRSDFLRWVDQVVEHQLESLPEDQRSPSARDEARLKLRQQFRTPQEQQRLLQQWAQGEVLYREALLWKLDERSEYLQRLDQARRSLLTALLIDEKVKRVEVDESDLMNWAKANGDRLGISNDDQSLDESQLRSALPQARVLYVEEKRQRQSQAFQQSLLERHKVKLFPEALGGQN